MSNNKRRSSTESSNALSNEIEKRPRSETTDSWIDWLKSNISLTTLSPTISAEQEEQQQEEEEIVDESVEQTKQSVWSWLGYGLTAKEGSRESITTDNVVLPLFDTQFKPASVSTSLFSKTVQAIQSVLFQQKKPTQSIIDSLRENPEKRIVVIGVHGWFPMKLVRSMMGEPTGTSAKFCQQMILAIQTYFKEGYEWNIPDHMITAIPLTWEGKVLERVEHLYKLILDTWADTLRSADIVVWATHSQGTPVSTILLQRLIQESLVDPKRQPICMLAMAGISHGPFPTLKTSVFVKYFEADAARELFEFMKSDTPISTQYHEAMVFILQQRIKVVFVGSMQDQVVPLYSAIMSGISHPNILRAVYMDGHVYAPDDFLIRLISFAIQLLNLGLSDHGFLIHISEVLAGNLYALEGGHSTIYEELKVFQLPLRYLFEASPCGQLELPRVYLEDDKKKQRVIEQVEARLDPFNAKARLNPFHLPWAMRGIWDDPRILQNDQLRTELETLQTLFEQWNPSSARLKEIKFRLEPLKARL
ncbi:hypothetical protein A0J61_08400 [Choanephora cucurbitarum]|uniref:YMC020W-like alpha/beta hydrolase domain-containing protein n=1 Tax=Choanephora cucurbitarum TaxID=101091 RepID=A0A1C7N388_9FUNG|nr:hypothetical protein A0J61_08400 [Choanephora cucurbitarum]